MVYKTREYLIWQMMKQRCLNPNNKRYSFYGERGIGICEEWVRNFSQFLLDMGHRPSPKHSIERIDNDKGYSKANCKWATQKEQCNNRRNTQVLFYFGIKVTMTELVEMSGIGQCTLWNRINRIGMSVEEAVKKPVRTNMGIILNGVTYNNMWQIAKETGINPGTLYFRIKKNGMSLEEAVKKPLNGKQWQKK